MSFPYVDAHCHLTDPRLSGEVLPAMIARSEQKGVGAWVMGGIEPAEWDRQVELARRFPGRVALVFGLHPWWASAQSEAQVEQGLSRLAARIGDCQGVGELGLDERKVAAMAVGEREAVRKRQLRAFGGQLELARRHRKPLILHVVQGHGKALEVLENSGVPEPGGLVHSFSGPPEVARKYVDLGLTLSISGVITRKGFESLKKAVVSVPGDSLVIETDAPDQPIGASGTASGELNEPSVIPEIAAAVAALRGESPELVLERSAAIVRRMFFRSSTHGSAS